MTDTTTTPYDRARLIEVVTYHQMVGPQGVYANPCACGHGTRTDDLGKSHAEHVADVYEASVVAAGGFAAGLPTPLIQIDPGDVIFLNGVRYVPAVEHPGGITPCDRLAIAAKRLLDNVTPFGSALEVEHHADGDELYGDLAEALGLPRDYRPEGA